MSTDRRSRTTWWLLAAVVVLGTLWWWSGRTSPVAQQRTYTDLLLAVDTALIQELIVRPAPARHHPDLYFRRNGYSWSVTSGGHVTEADPEGMKGLLKELTGLRVLRMLGARTGLAPHYHLSDSMADRLIVPTAEGQRELLVGANGESNDEFLNSSLSLASDTVAYAVYGDLSRWTERSFPDWIPKPMVNGDPRYWRSVTFAFPTGAEYSMVQHHGRWSIGGVEADQEKVGKYLRNLGHYRGAYLVDPADTLYARPAYRVMVDDSTRAEPMVLMVFAVGDRLIARSSLAPPHIVMPFDPAVEVPRIFRPPQAFFPDSPPVNSGS
jgi:hypothetical protein